MKTAAAARQQQGRVLVVEDERDVADLIRYNLTKEGYDVVVAPTGSDALKQAREVHPDLVLLDIMVPQLNGWEVCRRLKQDADTKNIPVIMVTGRVEEGDKVLGFEMGADDYVTKPFSPRELLARIRAVARRGRGDLGGGGFRFPDPERCVPQPYGAQNRQEPPACAHEPRLDTRRRAMKTAWITALALLVTGALAPPAGAQTLINGAGATFPYPIYSKWFDEYAKIDPEVRFNYQSIGSGGGIKQISSRTVDFGASDGPMTDEQLKQAPAELLHIPTVLGAVVATYNLPGSPKLRFAPDVVADIFLGKITKWNDARIAAANSGVQLPDQPILVVHRSDGSGTTYIWVDYLSKVSPEWQQKVGKGTSVNWPVGLGGKGNEGVAGQVKNTPGALGYVELAYAVKNKMPVAAAEKPAGEVVRQTRGTPTR